jgi:diacylglycerol kinase (ATP)
MKIPGNHNFITICKLILKKYQYMKKEKETKIKGSFAYQVKTFSYAFKGLAIFFTSEQKAAIHTALAIIAVLSGFLLNLSAIEWCFIVIAIVIVFITEILNSAIENLVDLVQPERNVKAGMIKDIAAGAVLFSSIGAFVIGLIIFIPKIIQMI